MMAATVLPYSNSHTSNDDKHLELASIVWVDADINIKRDQNIEQKLRSIINHVIKFQDPQQCLQYVERRSKEARLVFILSSRLGRELVPSIHKLRQVSSIYIYCKDKTNEEQWIHDFVKVRAVIVELDELVSQIKTDYKFQMKAQEPLSINMFSTGKSISGINGQFVFFQLLIDCLLRIKFSEKDITELISVCKTEYYGNNIELDLLREFQQTYSRDKALWWYTRESFFYKTMNVALRMQNIHMIFLYRSFISDIHRQLQYYQAKHLLRVYRSQLMSIDELNTLRQYMGQFISVNSFLSTSRERLTALFFLGDTSKSIDLERVLFEIDADPAVVITKPFADISSHSHFADEAEVLFMLGSIFRLSNISRANDQVWIIRMTLCGDNEHDFKQVLVHMKSQIGNEQINLRTLGKVLWQMGKFHLAEKYYIRFLQELLPDDPLLSTIYEDLGQITSQNGDYDMSIQWHQKAIDNKKQIISTRNGNKNKTSDFTEVNRLFRILPNTIWKQNGVTIAGGCRKGSSLDQLCNPQDLYVDDDQTVLIADFQNHRIMQYKSGEQFGTVVAGGNGPGKRNNQLNCPTDVIVDKKRDCLIISDLINGRVVQWPRQSEAWGETIVSNVPSYGLAMDYRGRLYIADFQKHQVIRWHLEKGLGTVVAGGNGQGNRLNQLNRPLCVFVDHEYSVYVSDTDNHRVMKWIRNAKEGILVAGGYGKGNALTQLNTPGGLMIDQLGTVYIADMGNNRIMHWTVGATQGTIVVGGNGRGKLENQLTCPVALSIDREGNLYVVDHWNHRVQRFSINVDLHQSSSF